MVNKIDKLIRFTQQFVVVDEFLNHSGVFMVVRNVDVVRPGVVLVGTRPARL
jgi:hypothetical protein